MIDPQAIADNLNRILAEQGSTRRIEPTKFDPSESITSAGLKPFEDAIVYLSRPVDLRGMNWHRLLRAGVPVHIRPYPGGSVRLLTDSNFGTVLRENAIEGQDFQMTPLAGPPMHTFICDECDEITQDLLLDDTSTTLPPFLYNDAIHDGFNLGGGGKKNRGLKSLGWILEQAQFFESSTYSNGAYPPYKNSTMLACPKCAPAILERKAAHKDLLKRKREAAKKVI